MRWSEEFLNRLLSSFVTIFKDKCQAVAPADKKAGKTLGQVL
jgi:hypothetical protein